MVEWRSGRKRRWREKVEKKERQKQWHRYFAWRPVRTENERWVWWKRVWRRRYFCEWIKFAFYDPNWWEYRTIQEGDGDDGPHLEWHETLFG